jgi:hypothetical protein
MDAPTSITSSLGHRFCQRHNIMLGFRLNLIYSVCCDYSRIGDVCYSVIVLSAYPAKLAVSPD